MYLINLKNNLLTSLTDVHLGSIDSGLMFAIVEKREDGVVPEVAGVFIMELGTSAMNLSSSGVLNISFCTSGVVS